MHACLCDVHVVVGAAHTVAELRCEAGGADSLHRECGVPQLGPVVPLHLHAVLRHPQEIIQARDVPACMT